MKFSGSPAFTHKQADKIGVLITNLGTPDAPEKSALRRYLKQFLSDPRVVEVPKFIWYFILNWVILNIRPRRSAKAYAGVWTEQGSPLMVHTQDQANALRDKLKQEWGDQIVVEFAMRYGNPSVDDMLESMLQQGVRKLVVLPLYPQYCASTTGSTFDAIAQNFMRRRWLPEIRFINEYCDNSKYIEAVASKIEAHWLAHGRADKLMFSYHGIPKRYLLNGDPYHCQCHKTSRLLATRLGLSEDEYITSFQSRFGREEWLKPYTDHTLQSLPRQGVKSIQVVCPGFSSDCLETIEEIGEENRDYFLEAGGESYQYIEALNSDDAHIEMMMDLVSNNVNGWTANLENSQRHDLATRMGAEK